MWPRFLLLPCLAIAGCVEPPSTQGENSPTLSPPTREATRATAARPVVVVEQPGPAAAVSLTEPEVRALFEDLLGREPTGRELQNYRDYTRSQPYTAEQLATELRTTREYRELTPERVIQRAYRDLLNREPDAAGMRQFRRRMIDQHWSPGQVRQALRESEEYQLRHVDLAIDRAYDDLLERKPDATGREQYRQFLRHGGSEEDMRARIRQSVEYRVTLPDAKTKRAYLEVLHREADASGIETYRRKIVDQGWTEEDVKNALRRSPEYKNRPK